VHTLMVDTILLIPAKKSSIASITGIVLALPPPPLPSAFLPKIDIHICSQFHLSSLCSFSKTSSPSLFLAFAHPYSFSLVPSLSPFSSLSLPLITQTLLLLSQCQFLPLNSAKPKVSKSPLSLTHPSLLRTLPRPFCYFGICMYI